MASAQPAKDPPSNLYLVAAPGQIMMVNKFSSLSACKTASTNWSYNQIAGKNDSAALWVAAVCLPIE